MRHPLNPHRFWQLHSKNVFAARGSITRQAWRNEAVGRNCEATYSASDDVIYIDALHELAAQLQIGQRAFLTIHDNIVSGKARRFAISRCEFLFAPQRLHIIRKQIPGKRETPTLE